MNEVSGLNSLLRLLTLVVTLRVEIDSLVIECRDVYIGWLLACWHLGRLLIFRLYLLLFLALHATIWSILLLVVTIFLIIVVYKSDLLLVIIILRLVLILLTIHLLLHHSIFSLFLLLLVLLHLHLIRRFTGSLAFHDFCLAR